MTEKPDLKQTLGRLLGPAEPEVGCDACFEELDRYVELEIAGEDATPRCLACRLRSQRRTNRSASSLGCVRRTWCGQRSCSRPRPWRPESSSRSCHWR